MPKYLATGHYRSLIDGTEVVLAAGQAYDIPPSLVGGLVRDQAPIDFAKPLTADQLADIERTKEGERRAALEAERADETRRAAIRDHVRQWGSARCPGRPGTPYPAGLVPAEETPHDAPAQSDTPLAAEQREGQWYVACRNHLTYLVAIGTPPQPPAYVDHTLQRYTVTARYRATFHDLLPDDAGSAFGPVRPEHRPKTLSFADDEVVELPAYIAEWVNRDSPDTLLLVQEDQ